MRVDCGQPWEGMSPLDERSRFCASCAKPVTDFTAWDQAALRAHFTRHPDACGLFRLEQVLPGARPLPDMPRDLLRGAFAAMAALSLATASGQGQLPAPQPIVQAPASAATADRAEAESRLVDDERCWAEKEGPEAMTPAAANRPKYYLSRRFPFIHRARMVRGRVRFIGCPSF